MTREMTGMRILSFSHCMVLKVVFAAALISATLAPVVRAADANGAVLESVLTTQVDGQIVIDTEGRLVDYRIESPITDGLRDPLQQRVRTWQFHPVWVGGKPVRARASMRVTLVARQEGENYKVAVDNVTFPSDAKDASTPDNMSPVRIVRKSMVPPGYPAALSRAGVQGIVLLYLRVGKDGRVEDVVAVQSSLLDVRGRESILADAVKMLESNTVKQARRWRFDVEVSDSGKTATPEDFTAAVPVHYRLFGGRKAEPGKWRTEVRGPRKEAAWLDDADNAQKIGVSDLTDNEMVPVASAFRLQTPVVGMAL
jgi:hypothetical protein